MKKKYELVVKGINNYPDKITVTVALEIGGYPSLLLPDVAISLDRTEEIRLLLLWHWKLVGIRHCCCQMWRLVLTVLKVPRWSFTKLRRKSRRSSFSWMLLPGYVKGMVRCRKSGPSF